MELHSTVAGKFLPRLRDPIVCVLAKLNGLDLTLSDEKWALVKELCEMILQPFKEAADAASRGKVCDKFRDNLHYFGFEKKTVAEERGAAAKSATGNWTKTWTVEIAWQKVSWFRSAQDVKLAIATHLDPAIQKLWLRCWWKSQRSRASYPRQSSRCRRSSWHRRWRADRCRKLKMLEENLKACGDHFDVSTSEKWHEPHGRNVGENL